MTEKEQTMPIRTPDDVVLVRQAVRGWAAQAGMNLVDQTKVVTAASELGRNALTYGGGGTVLLEILREERRVGLRLTFQDSGPGIPNIELALKDGFTTGTGLGLGLGGARRLSSEFDISSEPGKGTRVTIVRWNRS